MDKNLSLHTYPTAEKIFITIFNQTNISLCQSVHNRIGHQAVPNLFLSPRIKVTTDISITF